MDDAQQVRAQLQRLPIFPLPGAVLLPYALIPLHVFEPRYRKLVRDCRSGAGVLALANIPAEPRRDRRDPPRVLPVIGAGILARVDPLPDGRSNIVVRGVLRARIVDIGRRDARQRIAHILYEVLVRYKAVEAAADDAFDWPATQTDLADATGLTNVHVSRTLQRLREEGLVAVEGRRVEVLDRAGLREAAGFNPNYLHLDRAGDEPGSAAGKRVEGLI
jgi:Lon protease-like protein